MTYDFFSGFPMLRLRECRAQSIKGYQLPPPPISKSSPILPEPLPSHTFLKIPNLPILLANRSSQVFLIYRNVTVKLSSINNIHLKQQLNIGFFIFKFTLKYMLGNIYINKIHAWQRLYMISLYCGEGFFHPFNILLYPKESFTSNFKTARKKRFFHGTTSN